MRLRQFFEAAAQPTAVMAFGRMNPPTIGHAKLVDAIKSQPGDPYIFLSQSQKPKTDPLDFQTKLRYAKFFFPELTIGNTEVKTIIQALQNISSLGYENLIYVAGSDRVTAFEELINKYNGQPDKDGNVTYNFKSIKVVSAGERDPDADGAEGMSASKMRAAAAAGDFDTFAQGVPNSELAHEMFAAVRKGMGVGDKGEAAGDKSFDSMMRTIKKGTAKQATADRKDQKKQNQQQARDAFGTMFGGGNPAAGLGIRKPGVAEGSEIKIPTEDGITMQDIRLMAGEGKLTKKTVLQAIAVIRKQRREKSAAKEAAGVGIVTKQNATTDVPVGGEYMNVKKLFPKKKKHSVGEASYEGNIGIMELFKFFSKAEKENPKLVARVKSLIKQGQDKQVWKIVQDYTETKLVGKEFENIGETNSNAAMVKSMIDPAAQQRFAKLRSNTTAKLTDPNYDHNPDALNQHNAYPKKKHAEYVGHMKNIEMFDNPHQMIAIALNNAGLTPEEVLQNLPKGYQIPQQKPEQANLSKQDTVVAPGTKEEIENEASLQTSKLFKGVHIEVRPNKAGGFDILSDNSPAAATVVQSFDNVEDANKYAQMLDNEDVKALSTMSPSIKVQDDADLSSLRKNAGL